MIESVHQSWYLDPTGEHWNRRLSMEPSLQPPLPMQKRASSTNNSKARSGANTKGHGRIESAHETVLRQRTEANKLVQAKMQEELRAAAVQEQARITQRLSLEREGRKRAAETAKESERAAKKDKKEAVRQQKQTEKQQKQTEKQAEKEKAKAAKKSNQKFSKTKAIGEIVCEICNKVDIGWAACDGEDCPMDQDSEGLKWHKLCCMGDKEQPSEDGVWYCTSCK